LIHMLLIESNNKAAFQLSQSYSGGRTSFINAMNAKAKELGLNSMKFENETGLDKDNLREASNVSSARDLVMLASAIIDKNPSIMKIGRKDNYVIRTISGSYHHTSTSTNQLLRDDRYVGGVVGGKTGETAIALKNLVLVSKPPFGNGFLITAILGTPDNFEDTKKAIQWIDGAFEWAKIK